MYLSPFPHCFGMALNKPTTIHGHKTEQKACESSYDVCEGFGYISGLSHRIRKIFCINFHDNKIPLIETRDDLHPKFSLPP